MFFFFVFRHLFVQIKNVLRPSIKKVVGILYIAFFVNHNPSLSCLTQIIRLTKENKTLAVHQEGYHRD